MAGWLHGVFVGDWLFVFPLCGFSLSLFCNYYLAVHAPQKFCFAFPVLGGAMPVLLAPCNTLRKNPRISSAIAAPPRVHTSLSMLHVDIHPTSRHQHLHCETITLGLLNFLCEVLACNGTGCARTMASHAFASVRRQTRLASCVMSFTALATRRR